MTKASILSRMRKSQFTANSKKILILDLSRLLHSFGLDSNQMKFLRLRKELNKPLVSVK